MRSIVCSSLILFLVKSISAKTCEDRQFTLNHKTTECEFVCHNKWKHCATPDLFETEEILNDKLITCSKTDGCICNEERGYKTEFK